MEETQQTLEERTRARIRKNGFMHHNYIELESVEKDRAVFRLEIRPEDLYCVGDEANDLPMLRLAAEGFAPANCIPAVRESGATIVCHAKDGALADVVERLEKKYR